MRVLGAAASPAAGAGVLGALHGDLNVSLLSLCNGLAVLVGVAPAASYAGNTDVTAAEMVAWVNEAQARVADELDWQALVRDGAADLGTAGSLDAEWTFPLPPAVRRLVPDSLWLRSENRKVEGPLTIAEWERRRRQAAASPIPVFTVAGDALLVRTASAGAAADDGLVMLDGVLQLDAGLVSSNLLTLRYVAAVPDYVADAQVSALGADLERCILLCAVWLYRDAKGLSASSALAQYGAALSLAKARDMPLGGMGLSRGGRSGRGVAGTGRNSTFILDESRLT